ncbi:MAG: glycoside hydrolase family 31 protein [Ruminococcus callidus]|nr:alpha-glucosidase [Ruminococcus sp.]MDD6110128.1 glycoside hydrolase family 31 protein [Ruminococcus sp.]MDD6946784.1 glycoside hydrolase family 31 protein [Ruminococcus sp.]MDY6145693.1 glycoside hydrolase family 31 protein [Ruminococcus callidus]
MIKKYVYGTPFPTDAVVLDVQPSTDALPFFETDQQGTFTYSLSENDIVYGLGEQIRGINKRGWQYVSWNYDNPNHHEDTRSLYGAHNFIIIHGAVTFGAFFDYAGKMEFDIGYTKRSVMQIHAASNNLTVYIITGESEKDIVKQFRKMVGRSYIPPFWAFGYGQSRWGYKTEEDIRTVAKQYQDAGIPLDSIYLDIDYMERYKDFTVDTERFPNLKGLATDMKEQGIHLVPIIDAGVKIEDGYDVYEEGVQNNYFCKNAEGGDFVGAVWPGRVHFPDFLQPKARDWFGKKYAVLTEQGIDGFWNDMNEPAIFYTEDRLADTCAEIEKLTAGNMGIQEYFAFTGMVAGLNGNIGDYDKFYHNVDGKMVKHSEVHNLYGMNMTRSAFEALQEISPEKRTLFFSRSSYIGAHRYGGIWQGDNKSWWSHILQSMQQLPALNMAGFLFTGSDTGGFGCDTTEDLMIRWLQYSLFTPLFRNHSADGTREQELYQFSNVEAAGKMIQIRYSLIPYLYSEFLKAALNDEMMFKPLAFDFPDDAMAEQVEDQLLLGNELMIAPIYKQNAQGRYVYLPEEMMLVRMHSSKDYTTEILPKGHHYVSVGLDELVFFIRNQKAIPFAESAKNTAKTDYNTIQLLGYEGSSYELYTDNGTSPNPEDSLTIKTLS